MSRNNKWSDYSFLQYGLIPIYLTTEGPACAGCLICSVLTEQVKMLLAGLYKVANLWPNKEATQQHLYVCPHEGIVSLRMI